MPGEWYKASNIMVCLSQLHEKYARDELKKFDMAVFVEGTIFEDQILEKTIPGFERKNKPKAKKNEEEVKKEEDE